MSIQITDTKMLSVVLGSRVQHGDHLRVLTHTPDTDLIFGQLLYADEECVLVSESAGGKRKLIQYDEIDTMFIRIQNDLLPLMEGGCLT